MEAAELSNLMDIDAVQKILNRSRASIYRYTNTDPEELNPPYDPQCLNPELRTGKGDPLLFHPTEVARFAQEVLGLRPVTIEVKESPQTVTIELLREILGELREIRSVLKANKPNS